MKKFVFSAIAMMAFSVNSMGNTIELVSNCCVTKENFTIVEDLDPYCYDRSLIVGIQVAAYYPTLSDAQISWYMNYSIARCMGHSDAGILSNYPYPG